MRACIETKVFHRNLLVLLVVVHSNYTGVLLCPKCTKVLFFMIDLVWVVTADVYNVPLPMPLLHVSLLGDFTDKLY